MDNKDLCRTLDKCTPSDFQAFCETHPNFPIEFIDIEVGYANGGGPEWALVNLQDAEHPGLQYHIAFKLQDLQGILFGYSKLDDMPKMTDTRFCKNIEMLCRLRIISAIVKVCTRLRPKILAVKQREISQRDNAKSVRPICAVIKLTGEGEVILDGYIGV